MASALVLESLGLCFQACPPSRSLGLDLHSSTILQSDCPGPQQAPLSPLFSGSRLKLRWLSLSASQSIIQGFSLPASPALCSEGLGLDFHSSPVPDCCTRVQGFPGITACSPTHSLGLARPCSPRSSPSPLEVSQKMSLSADRFTRRTRGCPWRPSGSPPPIKRKNQILTLAVLQVPLFAVCGSCCVTV